MIFIMRLAGSLRRLPRTRRSSSLSRLRLLRGSGGQLSCLPGRESHCAEVKRFLFAQETSSTTLGDWETSDSVTLLSSFEVQFILLRFSVPLSSEKHDAESSAIFVGLNPTFRRETVQNHERTHEKRFPKKFFSEAQVASFYSLRMPDRNPEHMGEGTRNGSPAPIGRTHQKSVNPTHSG